MQIRNGAVGSLTSLRARPQQRSNAPQLVESNQPYFNDLNDGAQRECNDGVIATSVAQIHRGRDGLPEHTTFRDTGCSVSPSCLTCPLPRCRYDLKNGVASIRTDVRADEARRLKAEGWGIKAIAMQMGVTRRSVFRWFAADGSSVS
jgi:hypothetical protein